MPEVVLALAILADGKESYAAAASEEAAQLKLESRQHKMSRGVQKTVLAIIFENVGVRSVWPLDSSPQPFLRTQRAPSRREDGGDDVAEQHVWLQQTQSPPHPP